MYKVTLSGSSEGQEFRFHNYDDAFDFASMAVESGTFQDSHLKKDEEADNYITIWDDPVPVAVTIVGVNE